MPAAITTRRVGQGWPRRRGIVTGYVWKLIRESAGFTQYQLAEYLAVDVTTVQAWESGRRPLTAVSAADLSRFRLRLLRRSVHPRLFTTLNAAIEADHVLEHAIDTGDRLTAARDHPLAATVHRRDLTSLLTWPMTRVLPSQLTGLVEEGRARRGPVAAHPVLAAQDLRRLFAHLLLVADAHRGERDHLLRRQAVYLLAFDTDPYTRQWLTDEHVHAMGLARRMNDVPSWVSVRSAAVALAHGGDPDALSTFVTAGLAGQSQVIANLNYWAYWVSETADIHTDDTFMREPDLSWDGRYLLEHLVDRLYPGVQQAELYVHTLAQLLVARPYLLDRWPHLRGRAVAAVERALDANGLPTRARQQLSNIAFAIKLSHR
jgi:transcriptional regulator with XRE-family HTH domain